MQTSLVKKMEKIETELAAIKTLLIQAKTTTRLKLVSMRGLAKSSLSNEKLDVAIESAKKSLFHGA